MFKYLEEFIDIQRTELYSRCSGESIDAKESLDSAKENQMVVLGTQCSSACEHARVLGHLRELGRVWVLERPWVLGLLQVLGHLWELRRARVMEKSNWYSEN